jgi:hypothetical protein
MSEEQTIIGRVRDHNGHTDQGTVLGSTEGTDR